MVISFRLLKVLSTFQRYINWILKDYLDDFCLAYLDNMLIFSKRSLKQYKEYVCKILDKLKKTGLYLDISKYKFKMINIKYLGFIIKAGKGIYMDLEKIKVIKK